MSATPRTSAFESQERSLECDCHEAIDFARQLETELAEANEKIRLLTTDMDYVGGIQYWIKQHHDALVLALTSNIETRARGIEEAADIVMEAKWQKGSMNFNQGFIAGSLKKYASDIRKEDSE